MKRIFALLLTLCLLLSGLPVYGLGTVGVETSEEIVIPVSKLYEPTATGALSGSVVPGQNLAAGLKDVLDFEGLSDVPPNLRPNADGVFGSVSVEDVAGLGTADNNAGKALKMVSVNGGITWAGLNVDAVMETDRKYAISADFYTDLYTIDPSAPTAKCYFSKDGGGVMNNDVGTGFADASKGKTWFTLKLPEAVPSAASDYLTLLFEIPGGYGEAFYIDNINIVPWYKITYAKPEGNQILQVLKNADGSIMTDYSVLSDNYPSDTVINGSLVHCVGWSPVNGSQTPVQSLTLSDSDVTLYPVWETAIKPGINVFTGTENVQDFEGADVNVGQYVIEDGNFFSSVTVEDVPTASGNNSSQKALAIHRNTTGANANNWPNVNVYANMDNGRPYNLAFRAYTDLYSNGSTIAGGNAKIYVCHPWIAPEDGFLNEVKVNNWYYCYNTGFPYTLATSSNFQFKFEVTANDRLSESYYLDDLMLMPYYKVNYHGADKSVVATEYVLFNPDGSLMTSYKVDMTKLPDALGAASSEKNLSDGVWTENVALENKDIDIYGVYTNDVYLSDGVKNVELTLSDGFVFPTPTELGMSEENFVGWYDGVNHYSAGQSPASLTDIRGKLFTAFCQNPLAPAMGLVFEGDSLCDNTERFSYTDLVKDNGRNVLHAVINESTYAEPVWFNDAKLWFSASTPCDGSEYTILSYEGRLDNLKQLGNTEAVPGSVDETDVESLSQTEMNIYFQPLGGSIAASTRVGDRTFTVSKGGYYNVEVDMSDSEFTNELWNTSKIEKLAVEPARVNYGADIYVDYVRIYRKGISTVYYDTNAPEGLSDIVESNVSPDTDRGVGKGYMLTSEKPSMTGFTFMGWGKTPDATVNEAVDRIDITGDTTVYAIWISDIDIAPTMMSKYSIRTRSPSGLRFAALIDVAIKTGEVNQYTQTSLVGVVPDEYGFIISRKSLLGEKALDFGNGPDANGGGTTSSGTPYVSGVTFSREKGIDKVYDFDGSLIDDVVQGQNECFTAVLYNIPDNMYDEVLVARTYILIDGVYFYGEAREASLKSVATEMNKSYDSLNDDEKAIVDKILG